MFRRAFIIAAFCTLPILPLIAADALTQHYNNARTGAVLDETKLNTATVKPGTFGKLWTLYADGQVVAQPLYVSQLAVNTAGNSDTPLVQGTFNAIIVATMHNTVYVYDADKESPGPEGRTVPLWAKWLGPPRPGGKDIDMWSTNDPEWGIVATPVVSPDKKTLYVVAWRGDGASGMRYVLHALDLQKGIDRLPPKIIGVAANTTPNPCTGQNVFNPCTQKQRPALLLDNGVLYIAFGGDGNRGALFAMDAATLTQRAFWSATPTGTDGGIWQSGQGPSADSQGHVYLMTGNGSFNAASGGSNYGNSIVKLRLEGSTLAVKDYFTPCNFGFLNSRDLDLGSGGPVLLPVTPPRIIGGGKEGVLYVVSATNLGKHVATSTAPGCQNTNIVQQVHAFGVTMQGGQEHHGNIHGSPVFWNGPDVARVYAWGENSRLKAYTFSQGKLQNVGNPKMSAFQPPHGMPGGMLALSANGRTAGSGILWAVVPLDGDANQQRGVKGIVLGLDAQDVSRTLWTSEQNAARDRLGLFAKFNPPVVANGKVFVATYGDNEPRQTYGGNSRPATFPKYYVAVYGLLPAAAPPAIVDQNRDDVTVVRATTSPLSGLETSQCTAIDAVSVDCTARLTQVSGGAPAFHRVVLAAAQDLAGCAVVRVTTASKDAGVANAAGIGFWSAQAAGGNVAAENSGRFVTKAELKSIGPATLLNGTPATLHEFAGLANCPLGQGSVMGRLFKPYMQFEGAPDGRIFRNWDLAENYRIDGGIQQFDRTAQVLR